MKIPIGIFFGGATPIRDHSYQAAQRIVDLLPDNDFDPLPILVDPFGQLILLKKLPSGTSISEFYPTEQGKPESKDSPFSFYPEQLGELSVLQKMKLARGTGRLISVADLPELISIAFLTLPDVAELQQSMHVLQIPHTGELADVVALCADRYALRMQLQRSGFEQPASIRLTTKDWQDNSIQAIWGEDSASVAYPLLLRPVNQYGAGRSSVVDAKDGPDGLRRAIDLAFGQKRLALDDWHDMSPVDRENLVQHLAQWSSGIGFPLEVSKGEETTIMLDPSSLLGFLEQLPVTEKGQVLFKAHGANDEILVSSLPEGTAISCVLLRSEDERWDTADLRVLGNADRIVTGVETSSAAHARVPKIAASMSEQIATTCKEVADGLQAQVGLRISGILNGAGHFTPEEVQVFAGPSQDEVFDATKLKQFITASLMAGQAKHGTPVYRSLLELLTGNEPITTPSSDQIDEGVADIPATSPDPIVGAQEPTSTTAEPFFEPTSEVPASSYISEEEDQHSYIADQGLYERELEKLKREKEVIPEPTTGSTGHTVMDKDDGNLWTTMKLFFSSRLLWKNLGAIAAFLLLLFLTLNMSLRMYTRHGDSMQLEDYRGLLLAEAERKAAAKDLKIQVQNSVFVLGKRPGEIATQYPTPLSKVKEDRTIFVTIYKEQGGDVVLPAFTEVGDDLQSYRDALGNRKITLLVKDRVFRGKLAEGTILYLLVNGQKITNTELKRDDVKVSEGSTVEAVVSTRTSSSVEMPKLICDTYDEAVFHLQAKELVVGKVYGGSSGNRDSYYVWKQEPAYAPGKLIPKGAQVNIYLIPTRPEECE